MRFSITLATTVTAIGFVAFALSAAAAIDLTPEVREYTAEGVKFQQLIFHDDKQAIEYELPERWTFNAASSRLQLRPPDKKFAEAIIQTVSLTKPEALDENVCKALKEKFLTTLPPGSQLVKVEQEIQNPILLDGNPSFEIIVSYQVAAGKFLESALFVDLRDTQIVFNLTAPKEDFPALHSELKHSIFSWHWLGEKSEATASEAKAVTAAGQN